MTGTKLSCGSGACGACTIHLDGIPVASCLLPAFALHGRRVGTIEGVQDPGARTGTGVEVGVGTGTGADLAGDTAAGVEVGFGASQRSWGGALHPVQRALMAHDGLQCGFCTPGFVMEGVALYERWRATHPDGAAGEAGAPQGAVGTPGGEIGAAGDPAGVADVAAGDRRPRPSRSEVMGALAGHLCRCGAYPGIIEAVADACAGRFDSGPGSERGPGSESRSGPATGLAPTSAADAPRVEARDKVRGAARYTVDVRLFGQLVGRILRSPHAHARVGAIDDREALAIPGVHAVVDLLGDEREVKYAGAEIAAVAAEDRATAERALAAIRVEYEVLPAAIGLDAAMDPNAPVVHSGFVKSYPSSAEGPLAPARWRGNVRGPTSAMSVFPGRARRRIKAARAAGGQRLVEGVWETAVQVHTCLEPHACVADWQGEGQDARLTAYISSQAGARVAEVIAKRFGLPHDRVRVLCDHVGGGFGAKLEMTMEVVAAIELSRRCGRPVSVVLNREEELTVGGLRPGARIELAIAADESGALDALTATVHGDGGIAAGSTVASLYRFVYQGAPKALADYDVISHLPPGKPFRGPGAPMAAWALEQAVDELAEKVGVDPVTLRRSWDPHPLRHALMDYVERIPAWRDRGPVAAGTGRYRRGIGMAIANWMYFLQPNVEVEVASGPEGFRAACGVQDMGTGSRTVIARAVAEVFGIRPHEVDVRIGDSSLPQGPMSGGSRTTASIRPAALDAAAELAASLAEAAADHFGLVEARAEPGGVRHAAGTLPWADVLAAVPPSAATAGRRNDSKRYFLPMNIEGLRTGRGLTRAVHVSEVEVDTVLGKVRVSRVWAGIGCGRLAAPELARSQAMGGVVQGVGYALFEERHVDPRSGVTLTAGLEDYRIPGISDTPEIEVMFVEEGFEHVRGGAVGMGELSTIGVAASIGNAVYHATGWRPRSLPIMPGRVKRGISG